MRHGVLRRFVTPFRLRSRNGLDPIQTSHKMRHGWLQLSTRWGVSSWFCPRGVSQRLGQNIKGHFAAKARLSKSTWIQKLQDQLWAQISRCWENFISHAAICNLIICTCRISSKSICASLSLIKHLQISNKKTENISIFVTTWDLYLTYLIDFQHFPRSFEWFDTSHRMPPCLDLRLWRQVVLQHLHGPTTPFLCH